MEDSYEPAYRFFLLFFVSLHLSIISDGEWTYICSSLLLDCWAFKTGTHANTGTSLSENSTLTLRCALKPMTSIAAKETKQEDDVFLLPLTGVQALNGVCILCVCLCAGVLKQVHDAAQAIVHFAVMGAHDQWSEWWWWIQNDTRSPKSATVCKCTAESHRLISLSGQGWHWLSSCHPVWPLSVYLDGIAPVNHLAEVLSESTAWRTSSGLGVLWEPTGAMKSLVLWRKDLQLMSALWKPFGVFSLFLACFLWSKVCCIFFFLFSNKACSFKYTATSCFSMTGTFTRILWMNSVGALLWPGCSADRLNTHTCTHTCDWRLVVLQKWVSNTAQRALA